MFYFDSPVDTAFVVLWKTSRAKEIAYFSEEEAVELLHSLRIALNTLRERFDEKQNNGI